VADTAASRKVEKYSSLSPITCSTQLRSWKFRRVQFVHDERSFIAADFAVSHEAAEAARTQLISAAIRRSNSVLLHGSLTLDVPDSLPFSVLVLDLFCF